MVLDDLGVVQMVVGVGDTVEDLWQRTRPRISLALRLLLESLLLQLLVFLQAPLLDLPYLLNFPLDPIQVLCLFRVFLDCLDLQRVFHL